MRAWATRPKRHGSDSSQANEVAFADLVTADMNVKEVDG